MWNLQNRKVVDLIGFGEDFVPRRTEDARVTRNVISPGKVRMSRTVADLLWEMLGERRSQAVLRHRWGRLNPVVDALRRNGKIESYSCPS